jgi:hypothetical protein
VGGADSAEHARFLVAPPRTRTAARSHRVVADNLAAGSGPNGTDYQALPQIIGKAAADGQARLTINPAAIPDGSELSIGIMPALKGGVRGLNAGFALVQDGAHLTCTQADSTPTGVVKPGPGSPAPAGNGAVKPGVGSYDPASSALPGLGDT